MTGQGRSGGKGEGSLWGSHPCGNPFMGPKDFWWVLGEPKCEFFCNQWFRPLALAEVASAPAKILSAAANWGTG